MPTLVLDTTEGTGLDVTQTGVAPAQGVRTQSGIISGLDVVPNDPQAPEKAWAYLQSQGYTFGLQRAGVFANFILNRVRLIAGGTDIFRVYIEYSTLLLNGLTPGVFVYRDKSFLAQTQTNRVPGSNLPLRCGYQVTTSTSTTVQIPYNNCTITTMRPMRSISVTALIVGTQPPTDIGNNIGTVNAAAWGGLPTGYFVITQLETDYTRYQGFYSLIGEATSRVNEDWSEYGVVQNLQTGRYVNIADGVYNAMAGLPYVYGRQYPPGMVPADMGGIIKVGPFQLSSFPAFLGDR